VLSLFWAFLAKETAYWILPVWIVALGRDLYFKRNKVLTGFYLPCLFWTILLIVVYLSVCKIIWHNPFARLAQLLDWGDRVQDEAWAWSHQSDYRLLTRLTVEPVLQLAQDYSLVFALSIGGSILLFKKLKLWIFYFISFLFLYWFGSTSLTEYEPLYLISRYILPALPAMCIISGYFFEALVSKSIGDFKSTAVRISLLLPLLILCIPFVVHPVSSISLIALASFFLVLAIYLYSFGIIRMRLAVIHAMVVILLSMPMLNYFRSIAHKDLNAEKKCMDVLKDVLSRNGRKRLVLCSDSRSPEALAYYFGYRYPDNLRVRYLGSIKPVNRPNFRALYFVNTGRSNFMNRAYGKSNYDSLILKIKPKKTLFSTDGIYLFERRAVPRVK
jgi:hypothetical protein